MKCKKLGNHTISYQSLLLSTTVLNDMIPMESSVVIVVGITVTLLSLLVKFQPLF